MFRTDVSRPAGESGVIAIQPQLQLQQNQNLEAGGQAAALESIPVASSQLITPSRPHGSSIHTLITGNGSPYQNFQARIMYGTYKLVQRMEGGQFLTGFTRILHRTSDDAFVGEIPTFRAAPLHPECDNWCDFPVADRPNAVHQWVKAALLDPTLVTGAWVLLLECDYVWMRPLAAPDANDLSHPGRQFAFDYIIPSHPNCKEIIRRLAGGIDPDTIPASGPAPALLRFTDFAKVLPPWERVTAAIEADPESVKVLGWVREMYAWDIGVVQANVSMLTEGPPTARS
ncbi:MAG: hypothetical protein WDW38_009160 [Sanguina aurantia]